MHNREILTTLDATPLALCSDRIFAVTVGSAPAPLENPNETFGVKGREYVNWGKANRYPDEAVDIIGGTSVLSTGIGFKARTSFGQGLTAEIAKESLNRHADQAALLERTLRSPMVRDYLAAAFRDLFKFGNCYPLLQFDAAGQPVALRAMNARHCRLSKEKDRLVYWPDFANQLPDPADPRLRVYPLLMEDSPEWSLSLLRAKDRLRSRAVAWPRIKNYYSNNDYYALPDWDAAYRSGWVDVARKVPKFLERSYANAMSLMWHIQIPASFWQNQFPIKEYKTVEERQAAINRYLDDLENNLCGDENSSKTLITPASPSEVRGIDEWKIERLKNEIDAAERLTTSAAANSEILFSLMINPSVLGAGMPGGSYAGSSGSGSDIRESFMVSVITTYIEKQQVLDPLNYLLRSRFPELDFRLRYKETILTTLNTGQAQATITT